MSDRNKVLSFLKDNEGQTIKTKIFIDVFKSCRSQSELAKLVASELAGLVVVRKKKNKEIWKLTESGWAAANQIGTPEVQPAQEETIPDGFARFRSLAKENPDASPQRLLQLAGRSLGDPLSWPEWRETHPEWYLQQPRDWYAHDVELDVDGYPMRFPTDPLTAKERETRPTNERGWFERATRQPGASLEPLACEMPAFEVANVLRVTKKVGEQSGLDIFGQPKIELARRLAGITANY
ncbi:MAG TPA: hypothetical protein VFQ43_05310 [Nitrososphaera sp.]|nr:hypothetical protein [Nitrososphaera sp.]